MPMRSSIGFPGSEGNVAFVLAAPNCPKGNKIKAAARTVPPGIASLAVLGLDLAVLISLKKKEIFSSEQDRSFVGLKPATRGG